MERIIHKVVCGIFVLLRKLFMSSAKGVVIHNFILLCIDKSLPVRFGRKIPDIPEIRKILINGRWKTNTTKGFIRKTYLLSPRVRDRIIENLIWRTLAGYFRRRKWTSKGYLIPSDIFLSPTYKCNLNCRGCYADGHEGELPLSEIERITKEQEQLGLFHVLLFGGEPLLREDLWQVFAAHPHTIFDIFTNGTLLTEEKIQIIGKLGNIRVFISLEGLAETTDSRRGAGTYAKIANALNFCRKAGIYYGVSVTVRKENFEEVTGRAFLEEMNQFGILVISYVLYIELSCRESGDKNVFSELTTDQVLMLEKWGEYIQDHYPIYPLIGKNGSSLVTSCPAAASGGRIHITANGDVEPCVFCQYAADNIKGKRIIDVMDSEFFQRIRIFTDAGLSRFNPCNVRNSLFLRNYFQEAGAYQTTGGKQDVEK